MPAASRLENRLSRVLCDLSDWLEHLESDRSAARRRLRTEQRRQLERLLDATERATSRRLGAGWRISWPPEARLTGHDARVALGLAFHAAAKARQAAPRAPATGASRPRNRIRLPPKSQR